MGMRLKTRLSAGAALVTGLGTMGVVTALPAQAATTVDYSCTAAGTTQTFTLTLDTGLAGTATVGEELTFAPSGTVSVDAGSAVPAGVASVGGSIDGFAATISNGSTSTVTPIDIDLARTAITGGTTSLSVTGASWTTVAPPAGTYTISAPTTFSGSLTGYGADDATIGSVGFSCTYVEGSGSLVIDTVRVSEAPAPEEPTGPPTGEEPTDPPAGEEPTEPPSAEETPVTQPPTDTPRGDETPVGQAPVVPEVVQTDGLTPQMLAQEDDTAALALGGLLLAGVGAGSVIVARRRTARD